MLDADGTMFLVVLSGAVIVTALYQYALSKDRFTAHFKTVVITAIVQYQHPALAYKPGKKIPSREYKASSLYRYKHDCYEGDDLIAGVIQGVSFHSSELHTYCTRSTNRGVSKIFKGLFVAAGISSRFNGGTYIWPKQSDQLAGSVMDQHNRLQPMPPVTRVKSGDPLFDKIFRVCTTNPAQAGELLSEERRKRMLQIAEALQLPLSFSFVAGRCYIGIPVKEDLLEPGVYHPGDKEEIRKHFVSIGLVPRIIQELQLAQLL